MKTNQITPFRRALNKLTAGLLVGASIGCNLPALAAETDYKKITEGDFWKKIYPDGGYTFYCRTQFTQSSPVLNVGHIYPSTWISEHLGCRSERTCMRTNEQFSVILSDMHNMVPVDAYHYFKIKSSIFGSLDATLEPGECGVRKRLHLIDPPDAIKGDVARIHFYMHTQYGLPLNSNFAFLKEWHRIDPPDAGEIAKNNRVKAAQGNDNPFISQPELVDKLDY
jgi:deoxyribonuclease-1